MVVIVVVIHDGFVLLVCSCVCDFVSWLTFLRFNRRGMLQDCRLPGTQADYEDPGQFCYIQQSSSQRRTSSETISGGTKAG